MWEGYVYVGIAQQILHKLSLLTHILNEELEVVLIEHAVTRPRLVSRIDRRALFVPVFLVAALTSLLYLSQTSDVATTGYDIADLQAQKQELEMQNEQLRLKVAQLESLDRVDHEASTRLHMGPPRREIYVTAVPISIPPPVATPVQSSSSAESRTIALVHRIVRQVAALRDAILKL